MGVLHTLGKSDAARYRGCAAEARGSAGVQACMPTSSIHCVGFYELSYRHMPRSRPDRACATDGGRSGQDHTSCNRCNEMVSAHAHTHSHTLKHTKPTAPTLFHPSQHRAPPASATHSKCASYAALSRRVPSCALRRVCSDTVLIRTSPAEGCQAGSSRSRCSTRPPTRKKCTGPTAPPRLLPPCQAS